MLRIIRARYKNEVMRLKSLGSSRMSAYEKAYYEMLVSPKKVVPVKIGSQWCDINNEEYIQAVVMKELQPWVDWIINGIDPDEVVMFYEAQKRVDMLSQRAVAQKIASKYRPIKDEKVCGFQKWMGIFDVRDIKPTDLTIDLLHTTYLAIESIELKSKFVKTFMDWFLWDRQKPKKEKKEKKVSKYTKDDIDLCVFVMQKDERYQLFNSKCVIDSYGTIYSGRKTVRKREDGFKLMSTEDKTGFVLKQFGKDMLAEVKEINSTLEFGTASDNGDLDNFELLSNDHGDEWNYRCPLIMAEMGLEKLKMGKTPKKYTLSHELKLIRKAITTINLPSAVYAEYLSAYKAMGIKL